MTISPFETDQPEEYACPECGKPFDTKRQMQGHRIGKHRQENRFVLKGQLHPQWKPIEHGTNGGYQQELRRKIPRCDKCKQAHADYAKRRWDAKQEKSK